MNKQICAIVLAAGEGKRLRPYTADRPKCLVELGGLPLISHQISVLQRLGIDDIHIVTGYCASKIEALHNKTIHNSNYANTNMVSSLMCAADLLDGRSDVLITYGDIVYEFRIIEELLKCKASICTTVDKSWLRLWNIRSNDPLMDAETLRLDDFQNILELGKKPETLDEIQGQYMGLVKVSANFTPKLVDIYNNLDPNRLYDGKDLSNMYMTSFLQHIIDLGFPLKAVVVSGGWLEVDTISDLKLYNSMLLKEQTVEMAFKFL